MLMAESLVNLFLLILTDIILCLQKQLNSYLWFILCNFYAEILLKFLQVIFEKQCFGSGTGWIRVFSPIRIRILKVRIRLFINLSDLNDGFDKVFEEPDQKRQCSEC